MNVSNQVLKVLSGVRIEGKNLFLEEALDRKLYTETNKVLEAAGGKWNRKAKAHVFGDDPAEVIDRVILTGQITSAKNEYGYFPTPKPIVDRMIDRAQIESGMRVLEPSAGQGAIAFRLLELGCTVDAVEILPENANVLRLRESEDKRLEVREIDFLSITPTRAYDRVLMNPPFGRQADIRHVNRALDFLKPNGRLVAIMAYGVIFRQDRLATDFRQLVEDRGGMMAALPEGAFKESGTSVRTVMVTL